MAVKTVSAALFIETCDLVLRTQPVLCCCIAQVHWLYFVRIIPGFPCWVGVGEVRVSYNAGNSAGVSYKTQEQL